MNIYYGEGYGAGFFLRILCFYLTTVCVCLIFRLDEKVKRRKEKRNMIQEKKPFGSRGRFPRDTEAVCQVLEFICGRLGLRCDFREYVGDGVFMDDDDGLVDDVGTLMTVANDLRKRTDETGQRLGKLEKLSVVKKPGRPKKIVAEIEKEIEKENE